MIFSTDPTNSTSSSEDIARASFPLRQAMSLPLPHTGTSSQHPGRTKPCLLDHLKTLNHMNADTVVEAVSRARGRSVDDGNHVTRGIAHFAPKLPAATGVLPQKRHHQYTFHTTIG